MRLTRVLATVALALAAAGGPLLGAPLTAQAAPGVTQTDGPHAAADRPIAPQAARSQDGARVIRFDLGNLDLTDVPGRFVTPLRGSLVLPEAAGASKAPIVMVGHLRTFGCTGSAFAYPCPAGATELRMDQGMEYLGVALAKAGYATLIPDLSPTMVAATSTSDYPMAPAYVRVMTTLRDRLLKADAGDPVFGPGPQGRIDGTRAALITHSRSGLFAADLIAAWKDGPTPIFAQLAVGPAYNISGTNWSPPHPDVPYLGVVGDADKDVGFMGNVLLTHLIGTPRKSPALVAVVPGFGHMFFNGALRDDDDRKSCDATCPDGPAHERLLAQAAADWLSAIGPSRTNPAKLPLLATDPLPARLWGVPVQFLASSNGTATRLVAGTPEEAAAVQAGAGSKVCSVPEPANPNPPADACPLPEEATIATQEIPLRLAKLGADARVTYRLTPGPRPLAGLAVHVSPYENKPGGHPMRLTIGDATGKTCQVDVPGDSPALADRKSEKSNGMYVVGTVRVPMSACAGVDAAKVTSVSLGAPAGAGEFLIRGLDLVAAGDSASPAASTGATTPATTAATAPASSAGGGAPVWPWLLGGGLVAAAAGAWVVRSRRPASPTP